MEVTATDMVMATDMDMEVGIMEIAIVIIVLLPILISQSKCLGLRLDMENA